jgi:uncharacterized protein DUF4340
MFNRFKIKNLYIVFGILLALVLLTALPGNQKKNRSFKSELSQFDPSAVSRFYIYLRGGGERISFRKSGERWLVADASWEYNADGTQVDRMLGSISSLRALRLAAREKEAWEKYEVTDSLGIRVEVLEGDKKLADLVLGKFSYAQPSGPVNPYQQQQGTMTTYLRLNKEKEVYAVNGFLAMPFNGQLKNFRDQMVLKFAESDLQSLSFSGKSPDFQLSHQDSLWLLEGVEADSAAMAGYLAGIRSLRSPHFLSKDRVPAGPPTHQMKVKGRQGELLAQIHAYVVDSTHIAISSS